MDPRTVHPAGVVIDEVFHDAEEPNEFGDAAKSPTKTWHAPSGRKLRFTPSTSSNGGVRHPLEYSTERLPSDANRCDQDFPDCDTPSNSVTMVDTDALFRATSIEDISGPGGLFLVVKQSIASYGSQSLTSTLINEHISKEQEEMIFQWGHLKKRFNTPELERLYRKYSARIQHSILMVFLMTSTCLQLLPVILALVLTSKEEINSCADTDQTVFATVPMGTRLISLGVHIAILMLSCRERLCRSNKIRISISLMLLFALLITEYGATLDDAFKREHHAPTRIRNSFFLVLAVTIFLPFPHRWQPALCGVFTVLIELLASFYDFNYRRGLGKYVFAEFVAHLVALFVGCYVRYLLDITHRKSFLDRQQTLKTKCKIKYEKEREDQLMTSLIPKHISEEVRRDLRDRILRFESKHFSHNPFNELYIRKHKNITILYADIVNSMKLATDLDDRELVQTLDELFGKFDERAEKNNCMRIKLLGDCYYCVSGIPEYIESHANNCVNMGLDMIDIIRHIREEKQVDVDMRIGIHSGNVMSGIIGLKRWQYDIWSTDATLASHMEQTGEPGCVHITETTRALLRGSYNMRPSKAAEKDSYIRETGLKTYLIAPLNITNKRYPIQRRANSTDAGTTTNRISNNHTTYIKKPTTLSTATSRARQFNAIIKRGSCNDSTLLRRRTNVLGSSLQEFSKMMSETNAMLEEEIDRMKLSKRDQWCNPHGIQPLFLWFYKSNLEIPYIHQRDPLFRYYLLCVLLVIIGMATVHFTVMKHPTAIAYSIVAYTAAFAIIICSNIAAWGSFIWIKITKKNEDFSPFSRRFLVQMGYTIVQNVYVRITLYLVISIVIFSLAILGLTLPLASTPVNINNLHNAIAQTTQTIVNGSIPLATLVNGHLANFTFDDIPVRNSTQKADVLSWSYNFCIILSMTAQTVFLRVNYLLKLALNTVAMVTYIVHYDTKNSKSNPDICTDWAFMNTDDTFIYAAYLIFMFAILHVLDRQVEYMSRVDFLSQKRLQEDQKEAQVMATINHILIENVLPLHVARYYLERDRRTTDDLYHEQYQSVAVLFASIPNFSEFIKESSVYEDGLKSLQLLNEIICDFDKLLFQNQFSRVEKIKTIGSTYMAAAGLHPGRGSDESFQSDEENEENPERNVKTILRFAIGMQKLLKSLNQHAYQDFKLRCGVALGGVIAGVVGATKPQYDIWGDTVNVASRMDSSGVSGRIQVTQEVAHQVLGDPSFSLECRGRTNVKGKGTLVTYLLRTKYDDPPTLTYTNTLGRKHDHKV